MTDHKEAGRRKEDQESRSKWYFLDNEDEDDEFTLSEEFSEARISRLFATKPARIAEHSLAIQILRDAQKLRRYARDASDDFFVSSNAKAKKGWGWHNCRIFYVCTTSRITKLDLLIEDLQERVIQLEVEERQKAEALQSSRQAAMKFARAGQDEALAVALWHALDSSPPIAGFVYLKSWTMADGGCWYKVGVTNNPDRREAEQNVLPVAAVTIACVDVGSMDRARAIEAVIHQVLQELRITDANNRELFHLSDQQASAVKSVLERLE